MLIPIRSARATARRSSSPAPLLLVFAVLAAAWSSLAVPASGTTLRVWVDAPDGTPIAGLSADDFVVEVGGDEHAPRLLATGRASASTLLLVVDPTFMLPGDLYGVRHGVERFLATLEPDDRLLLAVPGPRLEIPVRFGASHDAVLDALGQLDEGVTGLRFERERVSIERELRRNTVRTEQSRQAELRAARVNREMTTLLDGFRAEAELAVERLCRQLAALIQGVGGLPGDTVMVYIGGRLPTEVAVDLAELRRLATGGRVAAPPGGSNRVEEQRGVFADLGVAGRALGDEALFEPLAQRAAAAGVTVHTLPAAALRTDESDRLAAGASKEARRLASDARRGDPASRGLRLLAEETGGRTLGGRRAGDDPLARVASDLRATYHLGLGELARSEATRVRVELRRGAAPRRARVRHRLVVSGDTPDHHAMRRTLSTLLLGELGPAPARADTPLFEGIDVIPHTPSVGALKTTIRVPLGGLALRPEGRVHTGQLTLFATAGSLSAGAGRVERASVPVRIPNHELLTSLGRRAELHLDVVLPPGGDRVAISVRDDFGGRFGSVVARVEPEPLEVVAPIPLDEPVPPQGGVP
ncbi:MAG: hypothetical protein AAGC60_06560 [Acidobacteriota bacterium]